MKAGARYSTPQRAHPTDKSSVASESSSEDSAEDNAETSQNRTHAQFDEDIPSYYWQIQKLIKCLRIGNHTATLMTLCALADYPTDEEQCQRAIKDLGGLQVLLNILDSGHMDCMVQSLRILKVISGHVEVRRAIVSMHGLQSMVKLLSSGSRTVNTLTAETIANAARSRTARRIVCQCGGIALLVDLLDVSAVILATPLAQLNAGQQEQLLVSRAAALALRYLAKSRQVKHEIRVSGGVSLLSRLLKSVHTEILVSVIGILHTCATEESFRVAIKKEGMIHHLLEHIQKDNVELQINCAHAIHQCAGDREVSVLVRERGALARLINMLQAEQSGSARVILAATGALWKCASDELNVTTMHEQGVIATLVPLLSSDNEQVLINTTGLMGACAQLEEVREDIKRDGGIQPLIGLLVENNESLLVNTVRAIGACTVHQESMQVIQQSDGVRLVWSLLKSARATVQAEAAHTVCMCIRNTKDMRELVTSFVGGLELIVSLLECESAAVLTAICHVIAEISADVASLAVITDHGVVTRLAALACRPPPSGHPHWRPSVAHAIACTCPCDDNRRVYGRLGVVSPLVACLSGDTELEPRLHLHASAALHQLSEEPGNCVEMHAHGVVAPLLLMCSRQDEKLQNHASCCLRNIRLLAVALQSQQQQQQQHSSSSKLHEQQHAVIPVSRINDTEHV